MNSFYPGERVRVCTGEGIGQTGKVVRMDGEIAYVRWDGIADISVVPANRLETM